MRKIKVLEVNNIDLPGRVFNGYNMIRDLSTKNLSIKQAVIYKQSNNNDVIKIIKTSEEMHLYEKLVDFENNVSIHNLLSITSPLLVRLKQYKEADIIHFHMFHNTKLSIPSLIQISKEKKVIVTLHDPWFFTGRCVHFYDCNKWKNGCNNCNNLNNLFIFSEDNCNNLWNIKKETLKKSNIDFIVSSQWMMDLYKESPIFSNNNNVHLISFGIDLEKYKDNNNKDEIREKFNIKNNDIVLFLRSQSEFKGTEFVVKALKNLNTIHSITILTCGEKGLLDSLKNKYNVIDLGDIKENEVIDAMNVCDMFIMPSKAESFGMMAVEAMACSRPVIIFNNTAMPSVTFAPECGVEVKNKDYIDLMEKIKFLIENSEERIRRGKLGREYCEKNYSYDKYNQNLKNLYTKIYNRKNKTIKYHKNINKKAYNTYLEKINNYIQTGQIDTTFCYSSPDYIDIINKVNERLFIKYIKYSYKNRIRRILKKSKMICKIHNKIKGR